MHQKWLQELTSIHQMEKHCMIIDNISASKYVDKGINNILTGKKRRYRWTVLCSKIERKL